MRSPFDTDESSWWAVHGASSSKMPVAPALELEPPFEPTEYVTSVEEDARREGEADFAFASEPFETATAAEDIALREQIAAQERETVRDVALVRTAAALAASEQQASL